MTNKHRKLTMKQAEQIRQEYDPFEMSLAKLGKKYGVSAGTIWRITIGLVYKKELEGG